MQRLAIYSIFEDFQYLACNLHLKKGQFSVSWKCQLAKRAVCMKIVLIQGENLLNTFSIVSPLYEVSKSWKTICRDTPTAYAGTPLQSHRVSTKSLGDCTSPQSPILTFFCTVKYFNTQYTCGSAPRLFNFPSSCYSKTRNIFTIPRLPVPSLLPTFKKGTIFCQLEKVSTRYSASQLSVQCA